MLSFAYSVPRVGAGVQQAPARRRVATPVAPAGHHEEGFFGFAPTVGFLAACASLAQLRSRRVQKANTNGGGVGFRKQASVAMLATKFSVLDESRSLRTSSVLVMGMAAYLSNFFSHQFAKRVLVALSSDLLSACTLIFGLGTCFSFLAWGFGLQKSPGCVLYYDKQDLKLLSSALFTHVATLTLTLLTAGNFVDHLAPADEHAWTALLCFVLLNMIPYYSLPGSLAFLACAVAGSIKLFRPTGNLFAIGSVAAWLAKIVLSRALLKSGKVDGMNLLSLKSLSAFLITLPAKFFLGGKVLPTLAAALR